MAQRPPARVTPDSYWQRIDPPGAPVPEGYPATFDDGRILILPIRNLPGGKHALASLIINQASFAVLDAIATALAAKMAVFAPDIIVGLPTLGLTLAAAVAQKCGHARYVPLGTSRKFWYDQALSVPLVSVTAPTHERRLFIDPRMVSLLEGRRVVLVDDVISTGSSISAGIALLAACGIRPVALATAMLQTDRWQAKLAGWQIISVLRTPLLDV
ncbi:MAG: phosphoribosyltransferase [Acidocella sp.]|nr:phosphoribosyltransferase [Acidocella sp.]